jgi:hypothetical protein
MKKTNALILLTLSSLSFNSFSQDLSWPMESMRFCADLTGNYSMGEIEVKDDELCREIVCKNEAEEETKRKSLCFPKPAVVESPPVVEETEKECEGEECEKESIQGAIDALQKVEETIAIIGYPLKCDPKTGLAAFDRDEPRDMDILGRRSRTRDEINWNEVIEFDRKEKTERDFGFNFINIGVNEIAGAPIDPECETRREWKFISKDGSKQETYMWLTDEAGSCKTSHRMESMFFMLPRVSRPSIKVEGDELHVILPTGEKVVYDKKTKLIKSGVLKEGKIDLNKDHRKRGYAPIEYSGVGIIIRSDQRGADPRQNPKGKKVFNAIITQGNKTCEIPRTELWSQNEKHFHFKFSDDQKLLEFINSKCEKKFSLE